MTWECPVCGAIKNLVTDPKPGAAVATGPTGDLAAEIAKMHFHAAPTAAAAPAAATPAVDAPPQAEAAPAATPQVPKPSVAADAHTTDAARTPAQPVAAAASVADRPLAPPAAAQPPPAPRARPNLAEAPKPACDTFLTLCIWLLLFAIVSICYRKATALFVTPM